MPTDISTVGQYTSLRLLMNVLSCVASLEPWTGTPVVRCNCPPIMMTATPAM
jgi:hypothetical protein